MSEEVKKYVEVYNKYALTLVRLGRYITNSTIPLPQGMMSLALPVNIACIKVPVEYTNPFPIDRNDSLQIKRPTDLKLNLEYPFFTILQGDSLTLFMQVEDDEQYGYLIQMDSTLYLTDPFTNVLVHTLSEIIFINENGKSQNLHEYISDKTNFIPKLVLGENVEPNLNPKLFGLVSDGYHTFDELYNHRVLLFLALMITLDKFTDGRQLEECGWSRRHSDGELCFGGGWCIGWIVLDNDKEIRYHFAESYITKGIMHLEKEKGRPFNGKEETLEALSDIISNPLSLF